MAEVFSPSSWKNSITAAIRADAMWHRNIRQRLRLQYGARATVSFRNRSEGACVELFLPIEQDRTEGETL